MLEHQLDDDAGSTHEQPKRIPADADSDRHVLSAQVRPELLVVVTRQLAVPMSRGNDMRAVAKSGCPRVLTEDPQHGQIIDGVRIEIPFRDAG